MRKISSNHYAQSGSWEQFRDNTRHNTIKTSNIDTVHNGENPQDRGALYNNHIAQTLNVYFTPHKCTNEQLSSTVILQASDLVSPTPQVTSCYVNNLSHSQDAINYPYMNMSDNNNKDDTDTSNSVYDHTHLNINQYNQPIRLNIVRDNIYMITVSKL